MITTHVAVDTDGLTYELTEMAWNNLQRAHQLQGVSGWLYGTKDKTDELVSKIKLQSPENVKNVASENASLKETNAALLAELEKLKAQQVVIPTKVAETITDASQATATANTTEEPKLHYMKVKSLIETAETVEKVSELLALYPENTKVKEAAEKRIAELNTGGANG